MGFGNFEYFFISKSKRTLTIVKHSCELSSLHVARRLAAFHKRLCSMPGRFGESGHSEDESQLAAGTASEAPRATSRRSAAFRDVAVRRAAFFAAGGGDGAAQRVNVAASTQGASSADQSASSVVATSVAVQDEARSNMPLAGPQGHWPGPFSTGIELMRDRAAARAAREGDDDGSVALVPSGIVGNATLALGCSASASPCPDAGTMYDPAHFMPITKAWRPYSAALSATTALQNGARLAAAASGASRAAAPRGKTLFDLRQEAAELSENGAASSVATVTATANAASVSVMRLATSSDRSLLNLSSPLPQPSTDTAPKDSFCDADAGFVRQLGEAPFDAHMAVATAAGVRVASANPPAGLPPVVRRPLAIAGPSGVRLEVPSLAFLCIEALARVLRFVDAPLDGLPAGRARSAFIHAVCRARALDSHAFRLLAGADAVEVKVPDCAGVSEAAFAAVLLGAPPAEPASLPALHTTSSSSAHSPAPLPAAAGAAGAPLQPLSLRVLDLSHCGRGFTSALALRLADAGTLARATRLRLHGAYALTDAALAALLRSAPLLRSLSVSACPLLTGAFLDGIATCCPCLDDVELAALPLLTDAAVRGELTATTAATAAAASATGSAAATAAVAGRARRAEKVDGGSKHLADCGASFAARKRARHRMSSASDAGGGRATRRMRRAVGDDDDNSDDDAATAASIAAADAAEEADLQHALAASLREHRQVSGIREDSIREHASSPAAGAHGSVINGENVADSLATLDATAPNACSRALSARSCGSPLSLSSSAPAQPSAAVASSAASTHAPHSVSCDMTLATQCSSAAGGASASGSTQGAGLFALSGRLQRLSLAHLPTLTTAALTALLRAVGGSLRALSLTSMPAVTDGVLLALSGVAPPAGLLRLQRLALVSLTALTDASLVPLSDRLRGLTHLELRRLPPTVTTAPLIRALLHSRHTLRHLALASLSPRTLSGVALATLTASGDGGSGGGSGSVVPAALSDRAVRFTLEGTSPPPTRLRTLDISFSRGIHDGDVGRVVDASPELERLALWGCTQLTPVFFDGHRRAAAICTEREADAGRCHACLAVSPTAAAEGAGGADCTCSWRALRITGRPGDVVPEPVYESSDDGDERERLSVLASH